MSEQWVVMSHSAAGDFPKVYANTLEEAKLYVMQLVQDVRFTEDEKQGRFAPIKGVVYWRENRDTAYRSGYIAKVWHFKTHSRPSADDLRFEEVCKGIHVPIVLRREDYGQWACLIGETFEEEKQYPTARSALEAVEQEVTKYWKREYEKVKDSCSWDDFIFAEVRDVDEF